MISTRDLDAGWLEALMHASERTPYVPPFFSSDIAVGLLLSQEELSAPEIDALTVELSTSPSKLKTWMKRPTPSCRQLVSVCEPAELEERSGCWMPGEYDACIREDVVSVTRPVKDPWTNHSYRRNPNPSQQLQRQSLYLLRSNHGTLDVHSGVS
ncbi:hypothetical protein BKA93DRAFT_88013 [Sparassis latifolia]